MAPVKGIGGGWEGGVMAGGGWAIWRGGRGDGLPGCLHAHEDTPPKLGARRQSTGSKDPRRFPPAGQTPARQQPRLMQAGPEVEAGTTVWLTLGKKYLCQMPIGLSGACRGSEMSGMLPCPCCPGPPCCTKPSEVRGVAADHWKLAWLTCEAWATGADAGRSVPYIPFAVFFVPSIASETYKTWMCAPMTKSPSTYPSICKLPCPVLVPAVLQERPVGVQCVRFHPARVLLQPRNKKVGS